MSLDLLVIGSLIDEAWGYLAEGRYAEQLHTAQRALRQARALPDEITDKRALIIKATDAEATVISSRIG